MTTVSNSYDVLYHYLTCVPHNRGKAVKVGVVIGDVVAIDLAPIGVATPPVAITARVIFVRGPTDAKGHTVDPGLAALHCLPGDPSLTAPFAHAMAIMVVAMTAVVVVARRIVEVEAIEDTVLFVVVARVSIFVSVFVSSLSLTPVKQILDPPIPSPRVKR